LLGHGRAFGSQLEVDRWDSMVTDEMRARVERALRETKPPLLLDLAKTLKDEGVDRSTLYRLFVEYQVKTAGDDPAYDAILDALDAIWGGPWAKGNALFPTELREEDIK
jgi:hypothetical protein